MVFRRIDDLAVEVIRRAKEARAAAANRAGPDAMKRDATEAASSLPVNAGRKVPADRVGVGNSAAKEGTTALPKTRRHRAEPSPSPKAGPVLTVVRCGPTHPQSSRSPSVGVGPHLITSYGERVHACSVSGAGT
jgi:hypothetical protein